MNEPWLFVEQIADHLGVTRDLIYLWIDAKGLPAHKIVRLWKFRVTEVDDWVRNGEAPDNGGRKSKRRYMRTRSPIGYCHRTALRNGAMIRSTLTTPPHLRHAL